MPHYGSKRPSRDSDYRAACDHMFALVRNKKPLPTLESLVSRYRLTRHEAQDLLLKAQRAAA